MYKLDVLQTLQHLPVSNLADTVIESHYKDKEYKNLREGKIVNSSEQNFADGTSKISLLRYLIPVFKKSHNKLFCIMSYLANMFLLCS